MVVLNAVTHYLLLLDLKYFSFEQSIGPPLLPASINMKILFYLYYVLPKNQGPSASILFFDAIPLTTIVAWLLWLILH